MTNQSDRKSAPTQAISYALSRWKNTIGGIILRKFQRGQITPVRDMWR